jgi:hypothetical protein
MRVNEAQYGRSRTQFIADDQDRDRIICEHKQDSRVKTHDRGTAWRHIVTCPSMAPATSYSRRQPTAGLRDATRPDHRPVSCGTSPTQSPKEHILLHHRALITDQGVYTTVRHSNTPAMYVMHVARFSEISAHPVLCGASCLERFQQIYCHSHYLFQSLSIAPLL